MVIRRSRTLLIAGLLAFSMAPVVAAPLMLRTRTTIPLPAVGQATPLQGLAYKPRRFEASIMTVTVQTVSAEGADPVMTNWVFTAKNNDGQMHRVEMQVQLLDESGKQIGWVARKHPVPAGSSSETFTVPMKVNGEIWRAAKKVRIVADWIN